MSDKSPKLGGVFSHLTSSRCWRLGLLVLIWSVYPILFTLSHNWFTVNGEQIWFLLTLIPVVCVFLYILCSIIVILFKVIARRYEKRRLARMDPLALSAVCIVAVVIYVFMHNALIDVFSKEYWIIVILFLLGCIVYILLLKNNEALISLLGAVLVAAAGVEWYYNVSNAETQIAKASSIARESGLKVDEGGLRFTDTPNIYVLIYDGYGSQSALKTIYEVDNTEVYAYLGDSGFVVLENSIANYMTTWPTVLSMFLADHHFYKISWSNNNDTSVGRLIMNGTALNPVFSVFKNNGYKIQFINRDHYFGKNNTFIDYVYPDMSIWNAFDIFDTPFLELLRKGIGRDGKDELWRRQREALDDRIELVKGDENPWFTFAYIYRPGHAKWRNPDIPSSPKMNWKGFENHHKKQLAEANQHIRHVVAAIQSKDPSAFIVVMGDHGGWRRPYGNAWKAKGIDDVNDAFRVNGASVETVTLDVFGILMAIETGGRCDRYVYDSFSPVNLMRLLFSCLSGEDLLTDRPADDAYFGLSGGKVYRTIRDGRVLDRWEVRGQDSK